MKICKNCQAENADELLSCAACGAALEEPEAETVETTVEMETQVFDTDVTEEEETASAEEAVEGEEAEEAAEGEEIAEGEESAETEQPKKKSRTGLIIGLVLAALLVVAVIVGKGQYDRQQMKGSAHHVNAHGFDSHSIHFTDNGDGTFSYDYLDRNGEVVNPTQEDVDALLNQEVASCAGQTLTNRHLLFYYDEQYYSFTNTYGAYLSFIMDSTKGLDEQAGMEEGKTWQQMFVDAGVEMFHKLAAISAWADANGYPVTDEIRAEADSMMENLDAFSQFYGFENGAAYLAAYYGPGASVDAYREYYLLSLHANSYLGTLEEGKTFTAEEQDAYYEENADSLTRLPNVDKNVVSVRHILIQPEFTPSTDGSAATATDESWAEAEAEAQRIYDEWLAGDATEESFAQMAATSTEDPGSAQTGGLYTDVYPGQMVAEFEDWCFADGRKTGDSGIVKTEYGFHIMYFVEEGDYIYWRTTVNGYLMDQWIMDEIANMQAAYPLTADLGMAVLLDAAAPTLPAPAAEEAPEAEATE